MRYVPGAVGTFRFLAIFMLGFYYIENTSAESPSSPRYSTLHRVTAPTEGRTQSDHGPSQGEVDFAPISAAAAAARTRTRCFFSNRDR